MHARQKDMKLTHASIIFRTYEMFSDCVAVTREEREREPTSCSLPLIAATRARVTLYIYELRKLLRDLHSTLCA